MLQGSTVTHGWKLRHNRLTAAGLLPTLTAFPFHALMATKPDAKIQRIFESANTKLLNRLIYSKVKSQKVTLCESLLRR
jgi:hypothetical protein